MWADLGDGVPDGIWVDADNAVWYGDGPNKRCVGVREGGEVLHTLSFACSEAQTRECCLGWRPSGWPCKDG